MMQTPLERAAVELQRLTLSPIGLCRGYARAVLEAIREPSKAMLDKGIDAADDVVDYSRDTNGTYRCDSPSDMPLPIWQAMLDTAIKGE